MDEDKINAIKMELADRYFVSSDEIYDSDVIDFLFAKLTTADAELGKSFNANDEIGMENIKLREQLATIERDTAEKCAEIIGHVSDGSSAMDEFCQVSDLQESILNHFNLGEKP